MGKVNPARYGSGLARAVAAGRMAAPGADPEQWTLTLLKREGKRAEKTKAQWSAELERIIRGAPDRRPPSPQQRLVLEIIYRYFRGMGEPCPARHVAQQLRLHHATVQEHVAALRRKGWLLPATARRGFGSYPVPALR